MEQQRNEQINEAVEMTVTLTKILQMQKSIDHIRKQTEESFKKIIREYERQLDDQYPQDEQGVCKSCGWMCEFEESHLRYSMNEGCSFVDENYTCNYCDHTEEFMFRHKKTGEHTNISL